ncbi:MAG: hypothetical protein RIQ89_679 [Bacteroidota bacterium]|jgi:hypothetical protein
MATKTTSTGNIFETVVENQKKMVDTMVSNTKQLSSNNDLNQTIEKGSDLYKNWLDGQLSFMNETTEKMKDNKKWAQSDAYTQTAKQWMDQQLAMTRNFMDFSMNTMKNYVDQTINNIPNLNGTGEQMKAAFANNMDLFKQWNDSLTASYNELVKMTENSTAKDAMHGIQNMQQSFEKFAAIWTPFIQHLQNKTFNAEGFKNMMNMNTYNDFFGQFFKQSNPFATMMNNMTGNSFFSQDWTKSWGNMFSMNANPMMNAMNPWANLFNTANPFNSWMNQFNPAIQQMQQQWNGMMNPMMNYFNQNMQQLNGQMNFGPMNQLLLNNWNQLLTFTNEHFGPMFRMLTPSLQKQNMEAMQSIADKMVRYNLKLNEYNQLVYQAGLNAMQKVAEQVQQKMNSEEGFKGLAALYTEYTNISDKTFVNLFETPAFAKVQGELAELQHLLKKEVDVMMEKSMSFLPLINRSEMDDNYKTIQNMKKRIAELEKQLNEKEETTKSKSKK